MYLCFRNLHLCLSLGECVPNDKKCHTIVYFDGMSSWTDFFDMFVAKVTSEDDVSAEVIDNVIFDDSYLTSNFNRKVDFSDIFTR